MTPFRILLVDASGRWLSRGGVSSDIEQVVLPLGLMSLSANIKRQFGKAVEVRLVHTLADFGGDIRGLEAILSRYRPHLAGVRGLHIYRREFGRVVHAARSAGVCRVIGGGPYVTADPETVMASLPLDVAVLGEGEETFIELLQHYMDGKPPEDDIPGIAFKRDGKVIITPHRPLIDNLDTLADPDYEVIDLSRYERFMTYGYNYRRQGVLLSSRGCPYRCIYCHNIFGRRFRKRSAGRVVEEIRRLRDTYGIRDIYFVDDNVNMDPERMEAFCDGLIEENLGVRLYFTNGVRGDILTPGLIDKMVDAGTVWITFAVETASERLQKLIRKYNDLRRLRVNIQRACDRGIMVAACFMVGFPSETPEEAEATLAYVHQFKSLVLPLFFSVKYYPHTEIHRIAKAYGIDPGQSDAAYDEPYHDVSHSGTPTLPAKTFQALYFKFLRETFLSRERLENALAIQRKFLDDREIKDMYSLFFRRRVEDIEKDVLRYAT